MFILSAALKNGESLHITHSTEEVQRTFLKKICLWTVNRGNGRFINSLALCFNVSEITSFISAGVCSAELSAAATLHFGHSDQGALTVLSVHLLLFQRGGQVVSVETVTGCVDMCFFVPKQTKNQQVYLCC